MTSFVHLDYSTQHPGVARVEKALLVARRVVSRKPHLAFAVAIGRSASACAALMVRAIDLLSVNVGNARYNWANPAAAHKPSNNATANTPKASL